MTTSYAHGTSAVPLLGETIGDEPAPHRRAVRRSRGARRALAGLSRDLPRSSGTRSPRSRAACSRSASQRGDRVGIWSPNRFEWVVLQYATARIGAILVNINPAYKSTELEYVLNQSGVSVLAMSRGFRHNDYVAMLAEVRARLPDRCARRSCSRTTGRRLIAARRRASPASELAEREAALQFDDPINIQYTSGTTGLPQGRDAVAPQRAQQRLLHRADAALHRARPRLRPGAVLPLLRHGDRQPRVRDVAARASWSPARRSSRWLVLETVAAERCTSLYGVPMMFIAELDHPRSRAFDLSTPAHRRDGRRAVPDRGDAQRAGADAHARGHDLLRHDRDLAGLDAERDRRSAREARHHRRARPPPRRDQDRRSGDRRGSCRAAPRASCARAATA